MCDDNLAPSSSSPSSLSPSSSAAPCYREVQSIHAMRHAQLCKSDILYELLYGANDETLLSHVKGLIDAKETPKPGQLTLLLGPMDWSAELQDAMKLLRGMDQHPVLGQPEHAGVRRTAYHAVLMACLPHIASFTMYVLDHSKSRESCMRFIHESLIKSEEQFFYGSAASESGGGGSGAAAGLESWVNYLRSRYACYV